MTSGKSNTIIIDGYMGLLENLSPENKLDLISKLAASVKADLENKKSRMDESVGAYKSDETADEIITDIRSSRASNLNIEPL